MMSKFDFNDFIKQYEMMSRMGSMANLIKLMPGMAEISEKQIYEAEKQFKVFSSLIQAMTEEERSNPDLIAKSAARRRRIVEESNQSEKDINQLIGTFAALRSRMENLMKTMRLRAGIGPPDFSLSLSLFPRSAWNAVYVQRGNPELHGRELH